MSIRSVIAVLVASIGCSSPLPSEPATWDAKSPPVADAATDAGASESGPEVGVCAITACGGSLSGNWRFVDACSHSLVPSSGFCVGQTGWNDTHLEGTATFASDEIVTLSTSSVQTTRMHLPKKCMPAGVSSCDRAVQFVPPVVGNCSDAQDYCDCVGRSASTPTTMVTHYTAEGASLHLETDGEALAFEFCVNGDWLVFANAKTGERSYLQRD